MSMDKIWADESSRAVEVLGDGGMRYTRKVEDKLSLRFTCEEWNRIFNVAEDYLPADPQYAAFAKEKDMVIFFVRRKNEGTTMPAP